MKVDVPWALGFIAAAAITGLLCNAMGLVGIVRLVIIVAAGVGGGLAGEFIAGRARR